MRCTPCLLTRPNNTVPAGLLVLALDTVPLPHAETPVTAERVGVSRDFVAVSFVDQQSAKRIKSRGMNDEPLLIEELGKRERLGQPSPIRA